MRAAEAVRTLAVAAVIVLAPVSAAQSAGETSCILCHRQLEEDAPHVLARWEADVHAAVGLSCHDCHGGNPDPALAEDMEAKSDESGFIGAPNRLDQPVFCARCHADAAYMKQFDPDVRVDQLAEYRTSVHGTRNAAGDPVPAVCTDCHGVHGILPVTSPDSPVFATRVPDTCGRCHADSTLMTKYGHTGDPLGDYRSSIHGSALLERGDTAAPSCNDCHGNHGAAPPGVSSVALVCGQCHGRESILFRASRKKELFHELDVPECSTCHGNHAIRHPTPEMFHSGSAPTVSRGSIETTWPFAAEVGDLAGGESAELTWTVVLHPHLEAGDPRYLYRIEVSSESREPLILEATVEPGDESAAASRTVRSAGLTAMLAVESTSGDPVRAGDALRYSVTLRAADGAAVQGVRLRSVAGAGLDGIRGSVCLECHSAGDECDQATERMLAAMTALERETREAIARLREAELRGMHVADEQFVLNSESRTAIGESRALIHAFDPDRLIARAEEGREVAAAGIVAADAALAEYQYRRKGLAVSLLLVGLVLLGLWLKIREVDRARSTEA